MVLVLRLSIENRSINIVADFGTFLQVAQLTGFSDPVYAEAYVNVNQYDIVLDLLIVNQTSDTLQNVTLELATLGKNTDISFITLCYHVQQIYGCVKRLSRSSVLL